MKTEEQKIYQVNKQNFKAAMGIADNTSENVQSLIKKDYTKKYNIDNYENSTKLLKKMSNFCDILKNHYKTIRTMNKQQKLNEKNKSKAVNMFPHMVKLQDSRFNLVEEMKQLLQNIEQTEHQVLTLAEQEKQYIYDTFKTFDQQLLISQNEPGYLSQNIKLLQLQDLKLQKQDPSCQNIENIVDLIKKSIDLRFEEKVDNKIDTISFLDHSEFIVLDMIQVEKYISKCFPKEIQIFNVYEAKYKQNFEKIIEKDIQNQEEQKEKFDILIKINTWICNYEQELVKAGSQPFEFSFLKSQLMTFLPKFQDHMSNLSKQYFEKCIEKDREQYFSIEQLDKCIEKSQEIKLTFPCDIFYFLNLSMDSVKSKLDINLFIEWIRQIGPIISETIIEPERLITKNKISDIQNERDQQLVVARIVILINSFRQCEGNCVQTMNSSLNKYKMQSDYLLDRIKKIFCKDIILRLKEFINYLIQSLLDILLIDINDFIIPNIFESSNDHKIDTNTLLLLEIVNSKLKFVRNNLKLKKIYYMTLCNQYIFKIVDLYWEQIIKKITKEYPEQDLFSLIYEITKCITMEVKQTEVKDKQQMCIFTQYNNFELLVERIEEDKILFREYLTAKNSIVILSQINVDLIINQFNTYTQSIQQSKSQINQIIEPIISSFSHDMSIKLFKSILRMKQEINKNEKSALTQKFLSQLNQNSDALNKTI